MSSSSMQPSMSSFEDGGSRPMYDTGGQAYGNIFPGNNNAASMLLVPSSSTSSSPAHQYFTGPSSGYSSQSGSAFQQHSPSASSQLLYPGCQPSGSSQNYAGSSLMMAPRYQPSQGLASMDNNNAGPNGGSNNHHLGNQTSRLSRMEPARGGGNNNNNHYHHLSNMALNTNAAMNHAAMYDYGSTVGFSAASMYGSPGEIYPNDLQYRQHLTETNQFGEASAGGTDSDQQPLPATLNDYYLAQLQQQQLQQQQQQNQSYNHLHQQQHASLYGITTAPPTSMMPIPSSTGVYNQSSQLSTELLAPPSRPKKRKAKTFPEKLMKVLMEYSNDKAVAWLPDGKSFIIVNADTFVKTVLNKGFKASKYASFVRKLHRWGFVRLTSGTGTDCFHHPLFVLGNLEQAGRISCAPPSARTAEKPPSLVGVERFIRAKVEESASKTFHETMDMRRMNGNSGGTGFIPRETKPSTLKKAMAKNKALKNSTMNLGKEDIGWGKAVLRDVSIKTYGECSTTSGDSLGKGFQEDCEKERVTEIGTNDEFSSMGVFSPRPPQSNDKTLFTKSNGDHPQAGRFFNAYNEAKPSGLEELANVANGLREQTLSAAL